MVRIALFPFSLYPIESQSRSLVLKFWLSGWGIAATFWQDLMILEELSVSWLWADFLFLWQSMVWNIPTFMRSFMLFWILLYLWQNIVQNSSRWVQVVWGTCFSWTCSHTDHTSAFVSTAAWFLFEVSTPSSILGSCFHKEVEQTFPCGSPFWIIGYYSTGSQSTA